MPLKFLLTMMVGLLTITPVLSAHATTAVTPLRQDFNPELQRLLKQSMDYRNNHTHGHNHQAWNQCA